MNKPSNPLENRIQEHGQVSVLLTLALDPKTFDTSGWPVHLILNNGLVSGGIWGGLNAALKMGAATPGEASHLLALLFDEKDYPDWLPNIAICSEGFSRVIAPILKECTNHWWPLGTEPPRPNIGPDSVRVTLRGTPVGEPTVRHCEVDPGNWQFQAALSVKTRTLEFRVFRLHPDREELQRELDAIAAAGDVQVFGVMDNGDAGDKLRCSDCGHVSDELAMSLDVMVEHWAPMAADQAGQGGARANPITASVNK